MLERYWRWTRWSAGSHAPGLWGRERDMLVICGRYQLTLFVVFELRMGRLVGLLVDAMVVRDVMVVAVLMNHFERLV